MTAVWPNPARLPHQQDKRSIVPMHPGDWLIWLTGSNDEAFRLLQVPAVEVFDAGPERSLAQRSLI